MPQFGKGPVDHQRYTAAEGYLTGRGGVQTFARTAHLPENALDQVVSHQQELW